MHMLLYQLNQTLSENEQEIPQSHTADHSMAPRGRPIAKSNKTSGRQKEISSLSLFLSLSSAR